MDWRISFCMAAISCAIAAILLYGLLGPAAVILWNIGSFTVGAIWSKAARSYYRKKEADHE